MYLLNGVQSATSLLAVYGYIIIIINSDEAVKISLEEDREHVAVDGILDRRDISSISSLLC